MIRQYVGARYVPKLAEPVEWVENNAYEALVIVTYNNSSYTSRKPVPPTIGNPADNKDYWALTGNYNAQVEQYRQVAELASENANSAKEIANNALNKATEVETSLNALGNIVSKNTNDIRDLKTLSTDNKNDITVLKKDVTDIKVELDNIEVTYANAYIVHKDSTKFQTINSAISKAKLDGVSLTNPKTIIVYPGDYNEQLILNDVHGLTIKGINPNSVVLHYNGSYPDCVIHAQGDISFINLTIKQDNSTTYVIHVDPSNTNVSGTIEFNNCIISGGSNAIGYGSGTNTELLVKNCTLSSTGDCVLYAHNSPYNKTGQRLTVINNLFKLSGSSQLYLRVDDAGYSNNQTTSVMNCLFANNSIDINAYGKMQFRKNTADSSTNKTSIPLNDSNIKFNANSNMNAGMPGINYREGNIGITGYLVFPANANTNGEYEVTLPVPFDTQNYTATLSSVTIPGVGNITGSFSIDGFYGWGVNIKTTNSGVAGKSLSVSVVFNCK